jgi:hypothetical protein
MASSMQPGSGAVMPRTGGALLLSAVEANALDCKASGARLGRRTSAATGSLLASASPGGNESPRARLADAPNSKAVAADERGERRPEDRATHRNGYRARRWDTRAGEIELQIPKIRQGSYFPSFLEPRRRSEQALLAVVQQAYVCGVSTRRVDQLLESLGLRVSKSEVSRVCGALDEHVEAFRTRPLEGRYPYLFLDAKVGRTESPGGSGETTRETLDGVVFRASESS